MPKPHLLYIMCDELRAFEVGCYGHPTVRTPHLDGLAERGMRFDVAVSNCPVCMPARSVVLSGQHARTCCGMLTNTALHPQEGGWIMPQWPRPGRDHCPDPTLPERLRDAGYRTHAIGKWHVEAWPDVLGFDHYAIPAHQHANSAQWFMRDGGPVYSPPGFGLDHEVELAIEAMTEDDDRPRFVYLNLSPPHMPLMDAPRKYLEMYRRDEVVLRDNVQSIGDEEATRESFLTYLWDYRHYRDRLPYCTTLPEGCDLTELHRLYYGLTTWVDDAVGRVLAALAAHGLTDRTQVVFTSDHGENLGSHGLMGKLTPNEESIRIPMIAAGPGVQRGQVSGAVASLVDVAPTLLDAPGTDIPDHMAGRSLSDALAGGCPPDDENHVFFESNHRGCGVRSRTHVVNLPWVDPAGDGWDLADSPDLAGAIADDPGQVGPPQTDDPDVARLTQRLLDWDGRTPWMAGAAGV
jgi:choline-sulfatase